MEKIFKLLKQIELKNHYYRLIATPEHIDVKVYSKEALDTKESNYSVKNTPAEKDGLIFNLELYLQKL